MVDLPTLALHDFPAQRRWLRAALDGVPSYELLEVSETPSLLAWLEEGRIDLLVTELLGPNRTWPAFLSQVRRRSALPILIVSNRCTTADRVQALRAGADDYLLKPYEPSELAARVEALLRRARQRSAQPTPELLRAGELSIDMTRHQVTLAGREPVRLTPTEARVLMSLARQPGQVRSRAELARAVWGECQLASTGAINTYIADLRRKLEPVATRPRLLQTVRGAGYRLSV
jgi:DNA-binding response OmpR family regulator